ncbi:excinuclease ABC subunit C [Panacagrimonas perspica]|uniref:UvrABC system protein C n=1 Tax=Panacagrimonas perspica TaxID=381431 RepID=A0A4S3K888_9GAMM|nr:excinuclease ABC subunit UvrC [Panacagrimonas perspica]TDU31998.1 excinuclease ABC subunit C [Panacagrimonas perspica]THD04465.1 excinuclease ABC subunit C [Panacagrimonas perspica]
MTAVDVPQQASSGSPKDGGFDARAFLSQLTLEPGVYRMYGPGGELLYVGKARNLRKRVSSYFLRASGDPRIEAMVSQVIRVEVTITHTEDEALILESNLIKELSPKYNIVYRDDKSYPYVRFTSHEFPRIGYYRGAKSGKDRYFGPFPSASAVRETLYTLQKLFKLRPCRDTFFANRQRPCLQHQIKRCSAPCVGLVTKEDYAHDLRNASRLLEGKADELASELAVEMDRAAEVLEFERAARLRDQIAALKRVRENRAITGGADDLDVIACAPHASGSCVVVMSVRDGLNLGHRSHFPKHSAHAPPEELIESFLSQHYLDQPPPPEILVSHPPEDCEWLEQAIARVAKRNVAIRKPQRGIKVRLMEMAQSTAAQALSARLVESASMDARLLELQQALDLDKPPTRMECFDISHTRGERTVASCVVFNQDGPLKSAYRKFNIESRDAAIIDPDAASGAGGRIEAVDVAGDVGIVPEGEDPRAAIVAGDDYAAIHQAVKRRFARAKTGEAPQPDVLFIDGGLGQLNAALEALDELGIENLRVVAIAKGPTRKPGLEELILPERELPLRLPPDSPALHLIQRIRDEAHRFAITGHRGRREKARLTSDLESIEGLGPTRRRALLKAFGGLAQLKRASVDEIAKVEGVNATLAARIHAHFR